METAVVTNAPKQVEEAPVEPLNEVVVAVSAPVSQLEVTEKVIWDRFKIENFSDVQIAGIIGNLRQESNFNTADQPSGYGIAQWLGLRRERLMLIERSDELGTQMNFILWELAQGGEGVARDALRSATTVESATIAFQNLYERCNPASCNQAQRITYAYEAYNRNK